MLGRRTFVLLAMIVSLMVIAPALAAVPVEGVVVEGQRVPGVALGDSRAQMEAAYGPASCQDMSYYDGRVGVDGICEFDADGGGRVTMYLFTAERDPAQGTPDDVVHIVRWSQAVSGWVTTAGINTTLALENPDAVIAAYPNAEVTYNIFGSVARIEDYALGITVEYFTEYLTGARWVSMLIRFPSDPPPPPPDQETHVTSIDLRLSKVKGDRQVRAYVHVDDENGQPASEASVLATWIYPNGSAQAVTDLTASTGVAYFEILDAPRGTLTLRIDDVVLEDHRFDRENSVLSASTKVK